MRITYIAAGAGNMRCGACARDITLVRGLTARGHDVQVIPLYTPLRGEDNHAPLPTTAMFYGGINVFLQQLSPRFARLPRWLHRQLDRPGLLRWASSFAVKTDPSSLGGMTASVLAGEDGQQKHELHQLQTFLESRPAPDIINLTNTLLSGIAPALKRRLNVPIVCTLQGEEEFIEAMPQPHRGRARELMCRNARSIDLFIAPADDYIPKMSAYLAISPDKIRVIRPGLDVAPYASTSPRTSPRTPFTLGYLSVITPGKGLDLLVDALRLLTRDQHRDVTLRVAGQILDARYWRAIQATLARENLTSRFEYVGELDFAAKVAFLHRCDVFSVPSRFAEARGMAVMEAIAAGVPIVVPDAGVYPELLRLTSAGHLFPRGRAADLAARLAALMDDPQSAATISATAPQHLRAHHSPAKMAQEAEEAYAGLVSSPAVAPQR